MKRLFFVFLLALVIQSASFASDFSKYRGVWASNDAEAVVTDSVCIFFENTPTGLRAFLNIPTQDIYSCTTYKDSAFVVETTKPLILTDEVKTVNGVAVKTLRIGDKVMSKVEDIITCKPYEKSTAKVSWTSVSVYRNGDLAPSLEKMAMSLCVRLIPTATCLSI